MGLAVVLGAVVELPVVVVERGRRLLAPRRAVLGHGAPALEVDAAVAEHLEVLEVVVLGGLGGVEAVEHARAFIGALGDPVDHRRLGDAGRLEHRGGDVDDVVELLSYLAFSRNAFSQCTMVPVRVPPQCEATCFVHWNGVSMACAQPTA